jgi:hypothetical protein
MGHCRIRATLRSACVRMAVALALSLYAGTVVALDGAVQIESIQVGASPLLLAHADTLSCNRGISTTGANLLFTQASMKYREAEAAPEEERLPLYVEVLALLDTIVRYYPHTDLACAIQYESSLGLMDVAAMPAVVNATAHSEPSSSTPALTDIEPQVRNFGHWRVEKEPKITLRVGEQGLGFTVSENGTANFEGQQLFGDYRVSEPDFQRLAIFIDQTGTRALALLMRDGAERIALVDLEGGNVLNDEPKPVWRYGPTDDAIWDPDNRFVAVRMPMAEYSTGLGVFELVTGRYAMIPDRAFDPNANEIWLADTLTTRADGQVVVNLAKQAFDEYGSPLASSGTPLEERTLNLREIFPTQANPSTYTDEGITKDTVASSEKVILNLVRPRVLPKEPLDIKSKGQIELAMVGVLSPERDNLRGDPRYRFPDDTCYYGAVTAGLAASAQMFTTRSINNLAIDVTVTSFGSIQFSAEKDVVFGFALDVGSAYFRNEDIYSAVARSIVERSLGYIIGKVAELDPDDPPDILVNTTDNLAKYTLRDAMVEEGVISGSMVGRNDNSKDYQFNGAPLTESTIKWFYSPRTHYVTAFLSAECTPFINKMYLIRFQMRSNFHFGRAPLLDTVEIMQLGR